MALSVFDDRSEEVDFLAAEPLEYQLNDLFLGIFHHRLARQIADSLTDTGVEQAEEVVDFGCGADSASRIAVDGLLLDRDNRAQAGNIVDVGTLEVAEHVAGVGGEGLDIAALALGIDRIESEGGFARTAEAGDDGQLSVGNRDVDSFEIMNPCATDLKRVHRLGVGKFRGVIIF